MSTRGKAGITARDRVRSAPGRATATQQSAPAPQQDKGGCGCGCKGENKGRVETRDTQPAVSTHKPKVNPALLSKAPKNINPTRAASLARRQALSTRGKAGISKNGLSAAQTARAANPNLSSRELAQELRRQRSKNGKAGEKKSEPVGRRRSKASHAGASSDQPWKVGASETVRGQTVTGTMVGRSKKTTGDEPSTCRSVTGTEYMGADIFREFCQVEPSKSPSKVRVSPTSHGNRVTGNEVGRSKKVTGDEPGTCKRVTGTEYVGANQSQTFCGTAAEAGPAKVTGSETQKGKLVTGNNVGRSAKVTGDEYGAGRELTGTQYMKKGDGKAPAKVATSKTLRGGSVSGTMVGRSAKVTGDEPGTCRNITGDDYVGQEQYSGFCAKDPKPAPEDRKVGLSQTLKGRTVSGTMTGRGGKVTGDEPGTCKAITGTPYAGAEQYRSYCEPEQAQMAAARTRPQRSTPGSVMTGIQPGMNGKMTGADKGACENVSGTPYVGADQFAAVCPSTPAEPGSPDFPQAIGGTPWGQFSVEAPSHAATQAATGRSAVTGSSYEKGQITGPFGMASGKVTGTEEARFGNGASAAAAAPMPETAAEVDGRIKGRITGEGMEAGLKITGDDWDRGDRVTGTEGMSAVRRNPTRRGGSATSAMLPPKRNEEVPEPVSKVTGGSGNTEKGSLITYSGGARG
jgi:hypothetical protein